MISALVINGQYQNLVLLDGLCCDTVRSDDGLPSMGGKGFNATHGMLDNQAYFGMLISPAWTAIRFGSITR